MYYNNLYDLIYKDLDDFIMLFNLLKQIFTLFFIYYLDFIYHNLHLVRYESYQHLNYLPKLLIYLFLKNFFKIIIFNYLENL